MILLSAITISIGPILRIHSGCKITNNSRIIALILISFHIGIKKIHPGTLINRKRGGPCRYRDKTFISDRKAFGVNLSDLFLQSMLTERNCIIP